jgi:hypothetical protein
MLRRIGFTNRTDIDLAVSVQMTRETLYLTVERRTDFSSDEETEQTADEEDDELTAALPPGRSGPSHEANFNLHSSELIAIALRPVDLIGWSDEGDPKEVRTIMSRVEKAALDMPSLHLELVKARGHGNLPVIAISFRREGLT